MNGEERKNRSALPFCGRMTEGADRALIKGRTDLGGKPHSAVVISPVTRYRRLFSSPLSSFSLESSFCPANTDDR